MGLLTLAKALGSKAAKLVPNEIRSPSEVLGAEEAGKQIWNWVDRSYRAGNVWAIRHAKDALANAPIKSGTRESSLVARLLDVRPTEEQISTLSPEIQGAYKFFRRKYAEHAVEGGLKPEQRVTDYFPHVFDWKKIQDKVERDLAIAMKSGDEAKVGGLMQDLDRVRNWGKKNLSQAQQVYQDLPQSIRFRHFEHRAGAGGYELDAVKSYNSYLLGLRKKLFDEPVVKAASSLLPQLSPELRGYAKWYLRDYLDLNRTEGAADSIAQGIRNFEFIRNLGFNPRSAVGNLTQQVFNVVELGPTATARGIGLMFKPEGRKLLEDSGHVADLSSIYNLSTSRAPHPKWDAALKTAGYLFTKVETANRGVAYLGGISKYLKKSPDEIAEFVRGGGEIPVAARNYASEIVRRTQGRYGKVDLPKFFRSPVGGVMGQFSTTPIKITERVVDYMRRDPKKLLAYLAIAQGTNTMAKNVFDVDLTDYLGPGYDLWEGTKALTAMSRDDWEGARKHFGRIGKAGQGILPKSLIEGRFGPGLELFRAIAGLPERGAHLISGGEPTIEVEKPRLQRLAERHLQPALMRNVRAAVRDYRAGGSPSDMVRNITGLVGKDMVVRKELLLLYEMGQFKRAAVLRRVYREETGSDLPLESESVRAAIRKRREHQRALAIQATERPEDFFLPPSVARRF